MWLGFIEGYSEMSEKLNGNFSRSLLSLQLQLKTILDGAGGDDALNLLDTLSNLNPSEQKIALKLFTSLLERIQQGERLCTKEDQALKDFEDGLYNEILSSMREAANDGSTRERIEVISGGRTSRLRSNTPIDLAEVRRTRKLRPKPLMN